MGFAMEMLILAALTIYVVTGVVGTVVSVVFIKMFMPMWKIMMKQMREMYSSEEEKA